MREINRLMMALSFVVWAGSCAAQTNWLSDVDYLGTELPKRHVQPFAIRKQADFVADVRALKSRIAEQDDNTATLELMRLVASLGDGHTAVIPDATEFRYLPINVRWFEDGLYITAAERSLKEVLGAKLVGVGELTAENIVDRFAGFLSHDNVWGVRKLVDKQFNTFEYLEFVGAVEGSEAVVRVESNGKQQVLRMKPLRLEAARKISWASVLRPEALKSSVSQRLRKLANRGLPFWNDWLPEQKAIYFKYDQCRDAKGFLKLTRGTAGFIGQNDVDKFILDIRDNAGGNSAVFQPLLKYLLGNDALNKRDKLFVLIGRNTFSSGLYCAIDMKRTNATFVGEPTGGSPNHFGEVKSFQLPSSKLTVQYSTKYHRLSPVDSDTLEPDLRIRYTLADLMAGQDPALAAVFKAATN